MPGTIEINGSRTYAKPGHLTKLEAEIDGKKRLVTVIGTR